MWTVSYRSTVSGTSVRLILRSFPRDASQGRPDPYPALEPSLLLLDEPFSALDYQTRLSVSDDIWKILQKEGNTALLVTHDISEAISMSDRVIILSKSPCLRPVRDLHSRSFCRPRPDADAKCARIQTVFSTDLEGVKP